MAIPAIYGENVPPVEYADDYRCDNLDLTHSTAAFGPEGEIAGLVLLARRGDRGYIADFGVQATWRGQGLAQRLLTYQLLTAKEIGIRTVQTDAEADNSAVLHVYENAGFKRRRDLVHLVIDLAILTSTEATETRVVPVDQRAVPEVLTQLSLDTSPPWSRELPSLLAEARLRAAYTERDGRPVACLAWRPEAPRTRWPLCHAALGQWGKPIDLLPLLQQASVGQARGNLALPLEPSTGRTATALMALGAREIGRSLEIHCPLG